MGRIVELCGEVAAEAEEGPDGLILHPEAWERLRGEWQDEDIEDAELFEDGPDDQIDTVRRGDVGLNEDVRSLSLG